MLDFLESLVGVLKDVLPGTQQGLSDTVLFQQYVDLVHAINEMCKDVRVNTSTSEFDGDPPRQHHSCCICMQGMIELVDPKAIERAMSLKVCPSLLLSSHFMYVFFE